MEGVHYDYTGSVALNRPMRETNKDIILLK